MIPLIRYGVLLDGESLPFGVTHSSFEAEILTISRAFELIEADMSKLGGETTIYVLTDSQSSRAYLSNVAKHNPPYLYKLFCVHMFYFWKRAGVNSDIWIC